MPPRGGGEKRDKDRQPGRKRPGQSSGPIRRKSCFFCKDKVDEIDYKNVNQLRLDREHDRAALFLCRKMGDWRTFVIGFSARS